MRDNFKVGDRVKAIAKSPSRAYEEGAIGTVTDAPSTHNISVKFDDPNILSWRDNTFCNLNSSNFVKIQRQDKPDLKVGMIVVFDGNERGVVAFERTCLGIRLSNGHNITLPMQTKDKYMYRFQSIVRVFNFDENMNPVLLWEKPEIDMEKVAKLEKEIAGIKEQLISDQDRIDCTAKLLKEKEKELAMVLEGRREN